MKGTMKKAAAAALAAVMAAGLLSGCGSEKKLDGTKTVATVNGTEIPMGVVSLYARQVQAQTEAMYRSFLGSSAGIWSQVTDEETGVTFGEESVQDSMKQVELLYLLKEKAADYEVTLTEEEEKAIAEAAAEFMADNDEETIQYLAVTEDQVKTLLELQTYREKVYQPLVDGADIEVTDEEAQLSSFTYVNVSTNGDDLTEEQIAEKKEQAQEILDKVKEDPSADMEEIAKGIDESYSDLSGTIYANPSDDEELVNYYPDEVVDALRTLKDGEVYDELVETENGYYILRLDKKNDEETSVTRKETIKKNRQSSYYTETTEKWLEEAEIKVDEKVLSGLKITDNHTFSIKQVEAQAEETPSVSPEEEDMEEVLEPEDDLTGEETAASDEEMTAVEEEDLEEASEDELKETEDAPEKN